MLILIAFFLVYIYICLCCIFEARRMQEQVLEATQRVRTIPVLGFLYGNRFVVGFVRNDFYILATRLAGLGCLAGGVWRLYWVLR